jgi:antitoxin (DNA-binding transcriptional repressor) of toxin-antitoxin stability system
MIKGMARVHMTEAEVAGDFAAVLRKIGHGEEVVLDRNGRPFAVIKAADQEPRTLSELIAMAERRERERGYAITLDEDYAADVEQIVQERKPWTPRSWE